MTFAGRRRPSILGTSPRAHAARSPRAGQGMKRGSGGASAFNNRAPALRVYGMSSGAASRSPSAATISAAPLLARAGTAGKLFDLRGAEPALTSQVDWPVPPIVTRAQWGANESLRKPGRVYNPVVRKIIVHHTGTPNSITDYPGLA